ncbi:transposase [Candidatus Poribacteria bacterium]|nr:transposase [Candidatus Poribacteria bacterium]
MMIYLDTRDPAMPQNHKETNLQPTVELLQFRDELRTSLKQRPDAILALVDALSSNTTAKSVVELSLNPCFGHQFTSVYDAIDNFFPSSPPDSVAEQRREKEMELMRMCVSYLPEPVQRNFWLFGLDVTPAPRPYARTLADRSCVYQPTPVRSNKPITYGHQYAALVYFPEKTSTSSPPWVVPLSIRRLQSDEKATTVHAQQIKALLSQETFPWHDRLSVVVADSTLSAVTFLGPVTPLRNLVTIARTRCNRVFYQRPVPIPGAVQKGHPRWYGARFDLKDKNTWTTPDLGDVISITTRRGRPLRVEIKAWHNLLMRGTREYPMHNHPLTLIRIDVTDATGKPVFRRPMWLTVIGESRAQLSLKAIWEAYRQRYDEEHFFRFGKQKLLTTAYQTPDVEHSENWWQITQLAYVQLWLARDLAISLPKPWERNLPQFKTGEASPSMVQRDFGRIIQQIESTPYLPKRRGKSPGRAKGNCPKRRERHKVIRKGKSAKKTLKSAA